MQGVKMDDFRPPAKRCAKSGPLCFTPAMEGISMATDGVGSTSPRSDCSDFGHSGKLHLSTPRNFPSRRSFKSKPIHPLSFPPQSPSLEGSGQFEYDATTPLRNTRRPSSGDSSSIDLADIADQFDPDYRSRSYNPCDPHKCGVCDRLLSQRSPWSSRRIIKSGDMPVTGVLSCRHVFHAECLEQTTPKSRKSDPPCPVCTKVEEENSPEQCIFPKMSNTFSRLRAFSGEGSSRSWGCAQVGDCVEGAHRSSMLLLNRNKMKKNISQKGNPSKDFPGKPKRSGSYPFSFLGGRFVDHGAGPSIKK